MPKYPKYEYPEGVVLNESTTLKDVIEIDKAIEKYGVIEVERYIDTYGPNNFDEKLLERTANVRL